MTEKYDCTQDVKDHQAKVREGLALFAYGLGERAYKHDGSKLREPEKAMFDEYTPKLRGLAFGSPEYKAALEQMGEGLAEHYRNNSHHPEHYAHGVLGMSLLDVVEMLYDWVAVCRSKGITVDLDKQVERFNLGPQLHAILRNELARIEQLHFTT